MQELSRDALEAIVGSIPAGVVVIEKEKGRTLYVNERAMALFGGDPRGLEMPDYSTKLMKLLTLSGDVFPPEQLPASIALLTGKEAQAEVVIERRDGTRVITEGSAKPIRDEKGEVIAAVAIFEDITKRKKIEEACRESEERFRGLVESTSDWIWQVNQNGVYTYVSPKVKDILGYEPQEVLGKTPFDLMPKKETEEITKKFQEILKNKESFCGFENWNSHKDGTLVLLETSGVPIFNHEGDLIGFRGIDRDITQRKKAEQSLRESEQLYRTLFYNSEDGFMLLEPIFDEKGQACDFRFLNFNPAYERQTGAKPADVLGKRASEVTPDLEPEIALLSGDVSKTGKPTHHEAYNKYSNKWYDSYIFPYAKGQVGILFRDITERKKAEEALRVSLDKEHFLAELVRNASVAVGVGYSDGRLGMVNDAFLKLTGYSEQELQEISWNEVLTPPEYKEFEKAKLVELSRTKNPVRYEKEYIRKNGSRVSIELIVHPFLDAEGNVTHYFFFMNDITERKKAEENLRGEKERFESLANSLPEIVFETDISGKLVFANKRGFEITGYTEEDFAKGFDVFSLIALQDKEKAFEYFSKFLNHQSTPYYEFTVARKDGSTFPAIIIANLIVEKGQPTGLRGIVVDITERKKAEKTLKETEEKLQKIIDQSPVVFELYDKDGLQVQVNPAWDKLWGIPRELSVGKWNILTSQQAIETGWLSYIKRAYAGETVFVPEKEFDSSQEPEALGKSRKRWLTSIFYPIKNESGEVTHIVVMHEDITEKKMLEQQLLDKERMAAIGQTAGMVGHDIRNPLQAVLSETFLLKDELASMPEGEIKEEVTESIDGIERNVAYINKIVQDLQDYARPVTPEYSIVDLSDVFIHVFETISIPDSINLSINVKDSEKIRIDPTLLQRAITNLVNNAIQAMAEGGKLEICGEKIENRIVVTVFDTGLGIPDEVKPKLFTPMMTTKAKGQGFGLAASKRMIEAMKGTISFESEKGKGTKFTIELPLEAVPL